MLNEKKLYARSCMNESPLQSYIGCIADACEGGFWVGKYGPVGEKTWGCGPQKNGFGSDFDLVSWVYWSFFK